MIQYKKSKFNKSFFITLLLLILLIVFSRRNPESSRLPSQLLDNLISPVNRVFYSASQSFKTVYDRLFGERAGQAQLEKMKVEKEGLRAQIRSLQEVVNRQEALKQEYQLKEANDSSTLSATVTARDPSNTFTRFTIDRGSRDGVKEGDIVVSGVQNSQKTVKMGLIGRISEVGWNYSKVISILDQSNNLSVLFLTSMSQGIINGRDGEVFFGYLLDAQKPLTVGEELVTAGIGGVYPRGLYVGKVSKVTGSEDELTKNFIIETAVDFSDIYRVLVVPNTLEQPVEQAPKTETKGAGKTARAVGNLQKDGKKGGDNE